MVAEAIEKGAVPLLKPCSLTRLAAVFVDQLRVSPGDDFM
jgi:hypothetical protein